jgi:hypothetical protein
MLNAASRFPCRDVARNTWNGEEKLFDNDGIGKTIPRKKCAFAGTSQMRKRSLPARACVQA